MPPGGDRPVVLVVDDEPAIRLLCRVNLELEGFEALEAATVAEARTIVAAGGIAVVLLDVHVGVEHGLELLGELAAGVPRIPVVVVSGSSELAGPEYEQADVVLPKPFRIEQLTATVRELAAR